MKTAKRSCESCGRKFTPKSARSRFCDDGECRRERARRRKRKQLAGNVVELQAKPAPDVDPGSVEKATRGELETARKVSSTIGQAALVLARQLDANSGDTGSSKAAVAGRLQALMVEALKDVKVAADPLDELRARRERRRGA